MPDPNDVVPDGTEGGPRLRRTLTFPLLTMYGIGTTVGAGVYVLTGKVVGAAGILAPFSFLLAAALAGLSALSFAELSARMPRSAGEAVYVRHGLRAPWLAVVVGLIVAASGIVSSAVIAQGFTGYVGVLVNWPSPVLVLILLAALVALAIWGIREAVVVAAVVTVIEVAGLILVIWVSRDSLQQAGDWLDQVQIQSRSVPMAVIASGAVLAFFAFIGFEDMVNVAEEVRDVRRVMPRAIIATLVVTTVLYLAVSLVALLSSPQADLAGSDAPLADLYARATGGSAVPIVFIGTLAVVNGALIQIIMAARVLYGLSAQGQLPKLFAHVHPARRTPVNATVVTGVLVAVLALLFPLETLARLTSTLVLTVFVLVNLSLLAMKRRGESSAEETFRVPVWVPAGGGLASAGLIVFQLLEFVGLV